MMNRKILVIDLKTFYASVECSLRGLDPFKTNLVVADLERGKNTICLAVTPAMKELGVKNRCRILDIPKDIKYIAAKPRMQKYIEYSANIYAIYLKYISKDDIYVYSIDECFLDVTNYLKLYNMDEVTLAKRILKDIFDTYHITATVGIGPNLYLAKVALDILSKHSPDNIGILTYQKFDEEMIYHEPLKDFWNIGSGIQKRLSKYKVYNMYGIRLLEDEILKKEFGVKGEIIKDHAFGIEETTIKEIKAYKPQNKSLSLGQVLFEDYNYEDGLIVLVEMAELLYYDLIQKNLVTNGIGIHVVYSHNSPIPSAGTSIGFDIYTNSRKTIIDAFKKAYYNVVDPNLKIRGFHVGFLKVISDVYKSINLFVDEKQEEKEINVTKAIIDIKNKYGSVSVLKGIDLLEKATTIKRSKLIGGHNAK